jgi:hypothetical protein
MLRGRQSSNLTIHAPWCITGCPFNIFYQTTCKVQAWGAAKALFCRNIMEACEAREHGSDSKQNHQVEGAIMQAKEWMRTFGRCMRSRSNKCTREEPEEERGSLPSSSLFMCASVVRNHLRLSHPPCLFRAKNHILNPLNVQTPK